MSGQDINERLRGFLSEALTSFDNRDYDSAIEQLRAAEMIDRENPEVLYNLGVTYCRTGLFVTAAEYFEKLLGLSLTSVNFLSTLRLLSYALIKLDRYEAALFRARQGLDISPRDTTLLNLAGYCHEKRGDRAEAIRAFRLILEIDGKNANACNSLAYNLAMSGTDLDEALAAAARAVRQQPGNAAYLDTIGYVCLRRGETALAEKFLKKALSLSPGSGEIKEHLDALQ